MATGDQIDMGAPGRAPAAVRFRVRPSLVIEAVWLSYLHDDETGYPARQAFYEAWPWTGKRLSEVWGSPEGGLTELAIIADWGEVLFESNFRELFFRLGEALKSHPPFEPMASESAEENARLRSRIARLGRERKLRERWFELAGDLVQAVETGWNRGGREALEAAERDLLSRLPEVGTYADLEAVSRVTCFNRLPELVADVSEAGREVTVVPALFGRKAMVLSLTSTLVVGPLSPAEPTGPSEGTRHRARRLRALGDPTRLAIFESVASRPRPVGELARLLGVAQPTVSNHVRILRDAGLVVEERGKGLSADLGALEQLLDETRRITGLASVSG